MKCDWCEENDPKATFDEEWDAVLCVKCQDAIELDMKIAKSKAEFYEILARKREVAYGDYSKNGT